MKNLDLAVMDENKAAETVLIINRTTGKNLTINKDDYLKIVREKDTRQNSAINLTSSSTLRNTEQQDCILENWENGSAGALETHELGAYNPSAPPMFLLECFLLKGFYEWKTWSLFSNCKEI